MTADHELLELLYDAARAEFGLVVRTNDPERLRMKLYPLRKRDPELQILSLRISPTSPSSELWIMKKEQASG